MEKPRLEKYPATAESPAKINRLMIGDKHVGVSYVQYFSRPFPHYYLGYVGTATDEREKGYGRMLMDEFESKLLATGRAGVLNDMLAYHNGVGSPLLGMYERRGWQRIPHTSVLTFNLPPGVGAEDLRKLVAVRKQQFARTSKSNQSNRAGPK